MSNFAVLMAKAQFFGQGNDSDYFMESRQSASGYLKVREAVA